MIRDLMLLVSLWTCGSNLAHASHQPGPRATALMVLWAALALVIGGCELMRRRAERRS